MWFNNWTLCFLLVEILSLNGSVNDIYTCLSHRIQSQVDDVVDIMKSNVNKVLERGDRLEDLQDKSGLFILYTLSCPLLYSDNSRFLKSI